MEETDEDLFTEMDQDFEVSCDLAEKDFWPNTPGPAKWILHLECPDCGFNGPCLICDDCHRGLFTYGMSGAECVRCKSRKHKFVKWIVTINHL